MPIDVASGAVHFDLEDFRIPGRFPLQWARRFHTGLAGEAGPMGPGWTNDFFAKLTRIGKDYHFIGPSGFMTRFEDPNDTVERSGTVRNSGSFQEISRQGAMLVVTKWAADGVIRRYRFFPERNGAWWPLRELGDDRGNGLELAWDEQGRLKGVRQKREKRTLAVAYNETGRIASVAFRHADGRLSEIARYAYDLQGRMVSAYDAFGNADSYEYDAANLLKRESAKDGGIFSYRYDNDGRCIRAGSPDNYDLKILRYLDNVRMTEVTNSLGRTTRYQHLATGQITLKLDPMGGKTETVYDEFGRIASKTGPMGEKTIYGYDAEGNRATLIDAAGNTGEFKYNAAHQSIAYIGPDGTGWRKTYDPIGRPLEAEDESGHTCAIEYNHLGDQVLLRKADGAVSRRAFSESGDLIAKTDWAGHQTRFEHDEFGRISRRIDPDGRIVMRKYDLPGRVIECSYGDGKRVEYRYNAGGNLILVLGNEEPPVSFLYGSCRRLLEKRIGSVLTRRYAWGTEPDRLESIRNGNGETYLFAYDPCDRVISETGFDGLTTAFKYDLSGRCTGKTNPAGQVIAWQLNPMGRVVKETLPDEAPSEFVYDKAGRILSARNGSGIVEFTRDAAGRIVKEDQAGYILERSFGPMGEILSLDSDAGAHFAYGNDANGLVERIEANGSGIFAYERNGGGQVTGIDLPGGLRLENAYDSRARLLRQAISSAGGAAAIVSREYAYGKGGTLAGIRDAAWGHVRYEYDEAQRLSGYKSEQETVRYGLDGEGNPLAEIRDGHLETKRGYGPGGRLIQNGNWRYAYDRAGRLIRKSKADAGESGPEWTYAWDAKDRLRSVMTPIGETWEYAYDAFGRRLSKRGPGKNIRFVWNHDVLLHEIEEGKTTSTWGFEPGGFKPLFVIREGRLQSVICDHLGTPRELLDPNGKVSWSAQFDPFGMPLRGKGPIEDCPFRLQGQYFDTESGLHYNRFRYFDPDAGRYISRDPILLAGGVSAYQYAPNPLRSCDPLGLCEETLYRTMSQEDYDELQRTGRMPATTETTTSPTQSFSEDYDGVLVEFKLEPGTIAELEAIGVRDDGKLTREKYPDMPMGGKGWAEEHARFKQEGDQINIALGKGDALDIFNDNIVDFNAVRP